MADFDLEYSYFVAYTKTVFLVNYLYLVQRIY